MKSSLWSRAGNGSLIMTCVTHQVSATVTYPEFLNGGGWAEAHPWFQVSSEKIRVALSSSSVFNFFHATCTPQLNGFAQIPWSVPNQIGGRVSPWPLHSRGWAYDMLWSAYASVRVCVLCLELTYLNVKQVVSLLLHFCNGCLMNTCPLCS